MKIKEIIANVCIVPLLAVKIADLTFESKLTNKLVGKTDKWIFELQDWAKK